MKKIHKEAHVVRLVLMTHPSSAAWQIFIDVLDLSPPSFCFLKWSITLHHFIYMYSVMNHNWKVVSLRPLSVYPAALFCCFIFEWWFVTASRGVALNLSFPALCNSLSFRWYHMWCRLAGFSGWLAGKMKRWIKVLKNICFFFFRSINGAEFSEGSTSLSTVQSEIQSQTDTSKVENEK